MNVRRITIATCALVLALGISGARQVSATVDHPCTVAYKGATTNSALGVRAPAFTVSCAGSWTLFEGLQWWRPTAGKWTYGGTRYVSGTGTRTVAAWDRPYHGCHFWRTVVTLKGEAYRTSAEWFCA